MSIVVSSHRMEVVERVADMVIVLRDGEVHAAGTVDEVCSLLCGGSILISRYQNDSLPLEDLLPLLKQQFYSCLINRIGHQVIITGTDVNVDRVREFLSAQHVTSLKLDTVQPSLVDAMRYHLNKMH